MNRHLLNHQQLQEVNPDNKLNRQCISELYYLLSNIYVLKPVQYGGDAKQIASSARNFSVT